MKKATPRKKQLDQREYGGGLVRAMLMGSVVLVVSLANRPSVAKEVDFCQQTSHKALHSCQEGAKSDNLLALGKCDNLSDAAAQNECKNQAEADKKDAQQTCNDQFDARQIVCDRLGPAPYDPEIDPMNFVDGNNLPLPINNPFSPLTPGTTFIYEGQTAQGFEHNEVSVTHNTKVILGVTCIEVHDTVKVDGKLTEDTLDWFAQDKDGNVWYFGENSEELASDRVVSLEGSWTGGVDGAKPGIIMKAQPAVGDFYRQEFALDTAEDMARVLSLTESVTVPYGSFSNCLETEETEPLEPDALEHKFYAAGVGNLLTIDLNTGERSKLIQIKKEN